MNTIRFVSSFRWRKAAVMLLLFPFFSAAQTLGGKSAYNFLKLPASPLLAAAGGVNVSYRAGEVGLAAGNPALLQPEVSMQLNASFLSLFSGAKGYSLSGALYSEKSQTTFSSHVFYLDYGTLPETDAAGNVMGEFRPVDYAVLFSAARQYLERWTYGLSLKWIHSGYGPYRSSAVAADVGVLYRDSAKALTIAVTVKNMGAQLRTYAGQTEELPFNLQAGITKRLTGAPFGFSVTAQHLQTFDILYRDTAFDRDNGFSASASALSKAVTHLVFATHIYLGQNLEATLGYNALRRRELSIGSEGNGLTGFSAGLRVRLSRLQIQYARAGYQQGVATNQIGVTVLLDRLFGLGQ